MNWLAAWRKRRDGEAFERGYNYAAGELLRSNGHAGKALHRSAEHGMEFDPTPFDAGIREALTDWSAHVRDLRPSICTVHDAQDCHRGCPYREHGKL